jgi:hypothetical protein
MAARWHEPVLHAGVHARKHERESVGLTYTRLVHRWNLPHAQANLWFVGTVGQARGHGWAGSRRFWSPAVMADYETTRIYFGGSLKALRQVTRRERRRLDSSDTWAGKLS